MVTQLEPGWPGVVVLFQTRYGYGRLSALELVCVKPCLHICVRMLARSCATFILMAFRDSSCLPGQAPPVEVGGATTLSYVLRLDFVEGTVSAV